MYIAHAWRIHLRSGALNYSAILCNTRELICFRYTSAKDRLFFPNLVLDVSNAASKESSADVEPMLHSLPSPSCTLPVARKSELTAWLAGAKPGERLQYHRGLLALDRIKGASSLREAERRKLAAVADHALALAHQGKVHLLQERRGDADYSYWAVARVPSGSVVARMRLPATAARNRSAIASMANPQAGAPHDPELSMAANLLEREDVAQ